MLTKSLDAFARLDATQAKEVIAADAEVDSEYDAIIQTAGHTMGQDPAQVERCLNTIWVARALERIGDHAKNISEHAVYLVEGEDVRHLQARIAR